MINSPFSFSDSRFLFERTHHGGIAFFVEFVTLDLYDSCRYKLFTLLVFKQSLRLQVKVQFIGCKLCGRWLVLYYF